MYSNASTWLAVSSCSRLRSPSAASTEGAATIAVARARGSGKRRTTAAVMSPSVPSAPTNRSRRS